MNPSPTTIQNKDRYNISSVQNDIPNKLVWVRANKNLASKASEKDMSLYFDILMDKSQDAA